MDLNKSKMRNIKAWLELEPNFPGVATPQSREWIIYIISGAYNPFTAPWGVCKAKWKQTIEVPEAELIAWAYVPSRSLLP